MQSSSVQNVRSQAAVNTFLMSVYNWMAVGLLLTAGVAWYVAHSEAMLQLIHGNRMVLFGLIIAELGMVFVLSAGIQRIKAGTATLLFVLYSALNGATLAFIFRIYTGASIFSTFVVCAAMFGTCSVYGMVTKKDLTGMGNFMFMGLIGIIIATVVNIFLRSSGMAMIISYVGVIVFVGLTAYDTQKIKMMALSQPGDLDAGTLRKGAIMGALTLYLDFINLFLMLLRIMGNRE
ncbi:Bax inhibitor-1/YccA family protein [Desulfoluna butyratoxydans]|uniref:Bax inhibitor 1-related n=1 Tax=Desulfoluna butyratoxydans TaxID=231438 RepID=A0A4U8YT45_9BACT|nr:Bax inhibitor-1/YccA family protein [Desulfoluna butyratoxydans]VFQ46707.1 bax inhibitor 1-related [Desulfoluna butyratoxydans]